MAGKKQFDVEVALDRATRLFWRLGYAETSVDALSHELGLGRSSLYGTFGDKDALFVRCLHSYAASYGARYDAALASRPNDPAATVRHFFEVALMRIADPDLPAGCLIAQSAVAVPTLSATAADTVRALLDRQRTRVQAALVGAGMAEKTAAGLALHVIAVNQSIALLSRAGMTDSELRQVVAVTSDAVGRAGRRGEFLETPVRSQ